MEIAFETERFQSAIFKDTNFKKSSGNVIVPISESSESATAGISLFMGFNKYKGAPNNVLLAASLRIELTIILNGSDVFTSLSTENCTPSPSGITSSSLILV